MTQVVVGYGGERVCVGRGGLSIETVSVCVHKGEGVA
jgi:hypothetical protein